jgi:hypothetical protein
MTDEPDRRHGFLAQLLATASVPLEAEREPVAPRGTPQGLSSAQIETVRNALPGEVLEWLEDRTLAIKPLDAISLEERQHLHDAVFSALMNAAPIVRSYSARRGSVSFPVWIAGLEGVFLLMAPVKDTLGPFSTLADAVEAMDREYGLFLVGD